MNNLNKETYDILDETLEDLCDKTESIELGDDHPLMKTMTDIANAMFHAVYKGHIIIPKEDLPYYHKPHARYLDDPRETYIPCPVCGSPPDSCLDHKHYNCDTCGEPLDLQVENAKGESMWACENCMHCAWCGSPNIFNTDNPEEPDYKCQDCGKFEPGHYANE